MVTGPTREDVVGRGAKLVSTSCNPPHPTNRSQTHTLLSHLHPTFYGTVGRKDSLRTKSLPVWAPAPWSSTPTPGSRNLGWDPVHRGSRAR